MVQFAAEIQQEGVLQVVSLSDQKNSVKAKIIPELGNNLVSLAVFNLGENQELISIPTDIQNLKNKTYQFYGNPILFPFPGRIPQGEFQFQNQKFQIPINFRDGTAIHGFVFDRKWDISEISTPSSKEAFLKSTYTTDSTLEKFFPFPFQIEMTYILREAELELVFKAINRGKQALPFGYGIHPYFTLPGKREDWVLYLPAAEIYELIDILPTGVSKKIPKQFDFRTEKSLQGIYMDDLFGKLKKNKQGFVSCWLRNRAHNFKLTVTSDQSFDYYVLYAPKDHDFICIEPYTCIPNAFNLANSGIKTGLRLLKTGESFEVHIWFKWEF